MGNVQSIHRLEYVRNPLPARDSAGVSAYQRADRPLASTWIKGPLTAFLRYAPKPPGLEPGTRELKDRIRDSLVTPFSAIAWGLARSQCPSARPEVW